MRFIEIVDNKVQRILSASRKPEGSKEIPDRHQLRIGDDIRFFNDSYRRLTSDEAEAKGLISVGYHESAQWEGGCYVVKADYRESNYWYKDSGIKVVFEIGDKPDNTMTTVEPISAHGIWNEGVNDWIIPADEKAKMCRKERTRLLRECDYKMLPDYPLAYKSEWEAYRQKLRDITAQKGFPDDVVWPIKPGEGEDVRLSSDK